MCAVVRVRCACVRACAVVEIDTVLVVDERRAAF
jgi:hypothetical protein